MTKATDIIKKVNNKDGKKTVKKFRLFLMKMKRKENKKEILDVK